MGKIFFGKLGDSSRISRLTLTQIALLVIAVAACLCPLARSHAALLTYSLVSGLFDGCLCVMIGLVTYDIVGRQMMARAVGTLYGIVAIPMTLGPPMAGTYKNISHFRFVVILCHVCNEITLLLPFTYICVSCVKIAREMYIVTSFGLKATMIKFSISIFFYIFVHNKSFRKILPNFNLLRLLELAFFGLSVSENLRPPLIFLVPSLG